MIPSDTTASNTNQKSQRQPRHVAIIMDGNGRWAQQRGLSRLEGHRHGADTCRQIVRAALHKGLEQLTLFCLSSENWKRPKEEIDALLTLLAFFLTDSLSELVQNKIRLEIIGRRDPIPEEILNVMDHAVHETASNTGLVLRLAINYGAHAELTDAVCAIFSDWQNGRFRGMPSDFINEKLIEKYLYTAGANAPDLLIRTGNESRISNFLLWQISYTELYFSSVCWPDFNEEQFQQALDWYAGRQRRYGDIPENI